MKQFMFTKTILIAGEDEEDATGAFQQAINESNFPEILDAWEWSCDDVSEDEEF